MPQSTVYAVASAKGGVGKTTTSINLGTALAARDLDVVVVELDLAMANVVDFLTLPFDEEADLSMHDVLAGEVPVADALYDAPGGATIAPSGTSLDGLDSVDVSRLPAVVDELSNWFDRVILDTGAGVNSATTTAMAAADETILVSTPRVASIRDTEKTRQLVERNGGDVRGVVITHAGTGSSPGSARLSEFLDVELLCTVPQAAAIQKSQDAGVPVVERRPDSDPARAYAEGADALLNPTSERTGDEAASAAGSTDPSSQSRGDDSPPRNPPSKEALEAEGWTFPGAGESADGAKREPRPESAEAAGSEIDEPGTAEPGTDGPGTTESETEEAGPAVTDYEPQREPVRTVSADGGDSVGPATDGSSASAPETSAETPTSGGSERSANDVESVIESADIEPPSVPSAGESAPMPSDDEPATESAGTETDGGGDRGEDGNDGEEAGETLAGRVSSLLRRR